MKEWTHFDANGNARMVDVSDKDTTKRTAIASGTIYVNHAVFEGITGGTMKKGDVLGVARVAGIMGAKRTSDLIPMCHPLMLTKVEINYRLDAEKKAVTAEATVQTTGQTGVEMEALTAVQICLLTIYDMCKAVDKSMRMSDVYLLEKEGGQSGHYIYREEGMSE